MLHHQTIRAWKDPEYRASLSVEELALMPAIPVGLIDLTDSDLGEISHAAPPTKPKKPRTALCPTAPKTTVAKGCTVTASYLPCKPKKTKPT